MSVRCSHCGEELMGAVNRCWRCGRAFAATPTVSSAPPVRREPVEGPLDLPPWIASSLVVAEVVQPATEGGDVPVDAEVGAASATLTTSAVASIRRGSPFSDDYVPTTELGFKRRVTSALGSLSAAVKRRLSRREPKSSTAELERTSDDEGMSLPTVAAIVGLVLGIVSLTLSGFPMVAVLIGVLGLAFTGVGFAGRSMGLVIVALLVCCLSTGISAYRFGIQTYEAMYGPFESAEEEEEPFEATE